MLTVYFALRIDWYTNEGQISNSANKRIDVSLRSAAQRDSIGGVHELIFFFITSQQPSGTELCYKTNVFMPACNPAGPCQ